MLTAIIWNDTSNEPLEFSIDNSKTWKDKSEVISIVTIIKNKIRCLKNESFKKKFISQSITKIEKLNNRTFRPTKKDLVEKEEPVEVMDAHQQKILQEELLVQGRKNQSKSDLQRLHEFVKEIPGEIIANVKKSNRDFQIADLLKRENRKEAPESARTNLTDFRVENYARDLNSTGDESSSEAENEPRNCPQIHPNVLPVLIKRAVLLDGSCDNGTKSKAFMFWNPTILSLKRTSMIFHSQKIIGHLIRLSDENSEGLKPS